MYMNKLDYSDRSNVGTKKKINHNWMSYWQKEGYSVSVNKQQYWRKAWWPSDIFFFWQMICKGNKIQSTHLSLYDSLFVSNYCATFCPCRPNALYHPCLAHMKEATRICRWGNSFFSHLPADALDKYDGGVRQVDGSKATAGIWATYPKDYVSVWTGFGDQVHILYSSPPPHKFQTIFSNV